MDDDEAKTLCLQCPACQYWNGHGPDPLCFGQAYFGGRSGKPQVITAKFRQKNPYCPHGGGNENQGATIKPKRKGGDKVKMGS